MGTRRFIPEMCGIQEQQQQQQWQQENRGFTGHDACQSKLALGSCTSRGLSERHGNQGTPRSAGEAGPFTPIAGASPNPFFRSRHDISRFPDIDAWLSGRVGAPQEHSVGGIDSPSTPGSFRWSIDQMSHLVSVQKSSFWCANTWLLYFAFGGFIICKPNQPYGSHAFQLSCSLALALSLCLFLSLAHTRSLTFFLFPFFFLFPSPILTDCLSRSFYTRSATGGI